MTRLSDFPQGRLLLVAPAALAALAVGLLAHVGLSAAAGLVRYLVWQRQRRGVFALPRMVERERAGEGEILSEEELYQAPNVSPLITVSALLGLGASWVVLDGPMRVVGLGLGAVPVLWKRRWMHDARQRARRQIARLIMEMRLHLVFSGTLGAVLDDLAASGEQGVVWDRLRAHRDLLTMAGPETVMERLVEEFQQAAGELKMLLRSLRAARVGGGSYTKALRKASQEAMAEIYRQAEMEVEAAPVRVMLPMLLFLFSPILIMIAYPLLARLLSSMTRGGLPMP